MTAEPEQTQVLIRQSNDYLQQLKSNFPKAKMDSELTVITARLYYLEDEVDNARSLLEQLNHDNWEQENTEALLDRAKALHEVGMNDVTLSLLDEIEKRCMKDPSEGELFMHYIQQQKSEKTEITRSPRELNNSAVNHYKRGEVALALDTFRQAFTVMPKNPSIALNLLQATVNAKNEPKDEKRKLSQKQIFDCQAVLENAALSEEQQGRYQRLKQRLETSE